MSKIVWYRVLLAVVLAFMAAGPLAAQPSLTSTGFTENFNSMGQDGTDPPDGWTVYTIPGNSATWLTAIPVDQIMFGTPSTGLTPMLDPTTRQNNGFNAATSDAPDDRALVRAHSGNRVFSAQDKV